MFRSVPIAVKLVLVIATLVAVVVIAAVAVGQRSLRRVARSYAVERRAAGEAAIARQAELLVRGVRDRLELPLGTNAYSEVAPILHRALADEATRGQVTWLVVRDDEGVTLASTEGSPSASTLAELDAKNPLPASGEVARFRLASSTDWQYGASVRLGTRVVGAVRMGVSTAGLEAELKRTIADAERQGAAAQRWLWWVAVVVLAAGVLLALMIGVSVARPVRVLTARAQAIAAGNFHERVDETRRDELGQLATSFNFMTGRVGQLMQEQAAKAALQKELSLAREVQQALLPPSRVERLGAARWYGLSQTASSCGGDWWTARIVGQSVLFVVGDATGHGIHSAMIAATARGAVAALDDRDSITPAQVLLAIDRAIAVGQHNIQMTCVAALMTPTSAGWRLQVANAGHPFPWLLAITGGRLGGEPEVLTTRGSPIGEPGRPPEIAESERHVAAGTLLVFYSDGLVERANPAGRTYGERRLRAALQSHAPAKADDVEAVAHAIVNDSEQFAAGLPTADDVTVLVVAV